MRDYYYILVTFVEISYAYNRLTVFKKRRSLNQDLQAFLAQDSPYLNKSGTNSNRYAYQIQRTVFDR